MSKTNPSFERVADEAALAFLRYALDSLDRAEHFAATGGRPETYLELRAARELLNQAADRLTLATGTAVPLAWQTYVHGAPPESPSDRPPHPKPASPGNPAGPKCATPAPGRRRK
ncbi:MAG TPA: hypothetical protein VHC95_02445 [Opitutales bacterium]|nr:hypothetical protein [Opitutales bacterium]